MLGKAVSLVMLPVYTRYLTPADYGVLALIQMTFEIVIIFAGTNLAVGVFRFYAKADRAEDKKAVLSTGLVLTGALSIVVGLILHTIARHFQEMDLQLQTFADDARREWRREPNGRSSERARCRR